VQFPTFTQSVIQLKDFFQEQRQRPSIQQQVLQGPDKVIGVLGESDEGQTYQRCFGQCKTLLSILYEKRFVLPFLIESR
jgi:hypothetical protein